MTREQRYQDLLKKVRGQFDKAESCPIVIEMEDGNVVIRQVWDGAEMVSIAEAKRVEGLVPEDFKDFFTRWHEKDVGLAANNVLENAELVDEVEGNRVCKVQIKTPWPIWNRVIVPTLYMRLDQPEGE